MIITKPATLPTTAPAIVPAEVPLGELEEDEEVVSSESALGGKNKTRACGEIHCMEELEDL